MKSSVIIFPGSNCDRDMDVALKKFGFKNKMVWHDNNELPKMGYFTKYSIIFFICLPKRTIYIDSDLITISVPSFKPLTK